MKRSELKPGEHYASADGLHYEIVDLDPGWDVDATTKQFVHTPRMQRRFVKGSWTQYQTNTAIRALWHSPYGETTNAVVQARHLVSTWAERQDAHTAQRKAAEARNKALAPLWATLGVRPISIDHEKGHVTVSLDALKRLSKKVPS